MKIKKSVITCAAPKQRKLPLQNLIDRDGKEKTVLEVLVEEVLDTGIDNIGCVIHPGDEQSYGEVLGDYKRHVTFITQNNPLGYGHAILIASDFVGNESFLHLVGDHLYVRRGEEGCAAHLVKVAEKEDCAVSAVNAIRESSISSYGVIGGRRLKGTSDLYKIENLVEKPTPTIAEQELFVPGLRAGHYLCFFGMHVLTPSIFKILKIQFENIKTGDRINLSNSLAKLAKQEQFLALEKQDWRYDVGTKYGLLKAQVALALSGKDRDRVLTELLELFTSRELRLIGR